MRPALAGNESVDLVENDGLDGAQRLARIRSQHQVDGFRRRDENVGRPAGESRALRAGVSPVRMEITGS